MSEYTFLFKALPYTVAILLILLIFLWRHYVELQNQHRKDIDLRDDKIYTLSGKAIEVSIKYRSDAKRESEEHRIIIEKLDNIQKKLDHGKRDS